MKNLIARLFDRQRALSPVFLPLEESDYQRWGMVDPIRVIDAAHLWVGQSTPPFVYPPRDDIDISVLARPVFFAIRQAVAQGRLAFVENAGFLWVWRSDLCQFAETYGQRPRFLFESMPPARELDGAAEVTGRLQ